MWFVVFLGFFFVTISWEMLLVLETSLSVKFSKNLIDTAFQDDAPLNGHHFGLSAFLVVSVKLLGCFFFC